ncbi:MAG: LysR family transcriptional regulator [Negativicutes bacterium]
MEIHQLQYIVEVAKQRNFTKAADVICVGQSTLSHQIAKLEEEIGIKIFVRNARTVSLTEAGAELVQYAQRLLAELEGAKQCMQAYSGLLKGTLHIGVIGALEVIDFSAMIANFHQLHPLLKLDIVQDGSLRLLEMLHTSEIDAAFITMPKNIVDGDAEFHHLAFDEIVLATSIYHPLARGKVIDLAEASNENFIVHPSTQSIYDISIAACRKAGFYPKIVCHSSHFPTSLALISAGMGVGFFPLEIVQARPGQLSVVRLKEPIRKDICVAMRRHHTPALVEFEKYVKQWVTWKLSPELR